MTIEPASKGHTGALFEGLPVPADSAAALKRSTPKGAPVAGLSIVDSAAAALQGTARLMYR